ncbi:hypothetical protein RZS08_56825, partial [Arthrospira platensis SPKY1]|nr:hypothetical protein [Arthrospira platensis SPKY1]
MDVLSGAAVGGAGKLLGSLTINHGARFYFDPQATLTVSAQVWLSRDFGVSSLIGLDGNTARGRYLLIENPLFRPQPGLFQNIGRENAVAIGQGKQAWFEGPG